MTVSTKLTVRKSEEERRMAARMMKCVVATKFGPVEEVVQVVTDQPVPKVDLIKSSKDQKLAKKTMLVKVSACSIAPGDIRVATGSLTYVHGVKAHPCILGGDLAGTVEECPADGSAHGLEKGDRVAVVFNDSPRDGLAEYTLIDPSFAIKLPDWIDFPTAAALTSSALTALKLSKRVTKNERVLILGGSGPVGTSLVQLVKNVSGAAFVAATSTDVTLVSGLGADKVIDYTKEAWWEEPTFKSNPFDIVFDCVGGKQSWIHAKKSGCVKNGWHGGRYVSLIGDDPWLEVHNMTGMIAVGLRVLFRVVLSTLWPFSPKYRVNASFPRDQATYDELYDHIQNHRLQIVLDPESPFQMTTPSVRKAFQKQQERKAHGKIVIDVSSPAIPTPVK